MMNLETRSPRGVVTTAPAGEMPTDAELLARWSAGTDPSALELLIRQHGGMVFGVCRRTLGNTPDADDAFQATFLILVRKARTLARPEQVAGWLHAVALRVARRAWADRNRRHQREVMIVDPAAPEPPEDTRDLRRVLDEELDRLPEKYRLPIVLCELEGRTLEEAAQLLGWPKGTVAGRLSRGREMLRQRLARRGFGLPLFLNGGIPGLDASIPPDPLVSATLITVDGTASGLSSHVAALAALVGGSRRWLALLLLLLFTAGAGAAVAWQVWPSANQPTPVAPDQVPAGRGCHSPA